MTIKGWIKLVGRRTCLTAGCQNDIRRITWTHPLPRKDRPDGERRIPFAPLPTSRRCYACAAAIYENERRYGRKPTVEVGRPDLPDSVSEMLEANDRRERFPEYQGPSDRQWRLDALSAR